MNVAAMDVVTLYTATFLSLRPNEFGSAEERVRR
jgi:hypothetical protein